MTGKDPFKKGGKKKRAVMPRAVSEHVHVHDYEYDL